VGDKKEGVAMERGGLRDGLDLEVLATRTYAAVFSDACDWAGRRAQTLAPGLAALAGGSRTLVGWARIARSEPVDGPPDPPFASEIAFLDSLKPGEVVVATAGGAQTALWGELFSAAAMARGARGAVIDGLARDVERVAALGFTVYARGTRPTDSLGRVSLVDTEGRVEMGDVGVSNGDLVVADADGVVIVPAELAGGVSAYALEKAATERKGLAALRAGGYLAEVWQRYGVL
jgi:regulator of RNase E activity RraA